MSNLWRKANIFLLDFLKPKKVSFQKSKEIQKNITFLIV